MKIKIYGNRPYLYENPGDGQPLRGFDSRPAPADGVVADNELLVVVRYDEGRGGDGRETRLVFVPGAIFRAAIGDEYFPSSTTVEGELDIQRCHWSRESLRRRDLGDEYAQALYGICTAT